MSNEFTDPEDPRQILNKANATLISNNAALKKRLATAEAALRRILDHANDTGEDPGYLLGVIADAAQEALAR